MTLKTRAKLGEIIETIMGFIVGVAAGFFWRDRISKARHARALEGRKRREQKWEHNQSAAFDIPPHWRSTIMDLLARRRR